MNTELELLETAQGAEKLSFVAYNNDKITDAEISEESHRTNWSKTPKQAKQYLGFEEIKIIHPKAGDTWKAFGLFVDANGNQATKSLNFSKSIHESGNYGKFDIQYRTGLAKDRDGNVITPLKLESYYLGVKVAETSRQTTVDLSR